MEQATPESLRTFLDENVLDLQQMDLVEFRDWLKQRVEESSRRPLFQARLALRDLKRQHRARLKARETRLERAKDLYHADPISQELQQLSEELRDIGKAVEGLTKAVSENRADPEKLAGFLKRLEEATAREQRLIAGSKTRQKFDQARSSLDELHQEIGIPALEDNIAQIASDRGNISTRSGESFEEIASEATHKLVAAQTANGFGSETESIFILHGLTLGCARGEFDQMVVRAASPEEPVEVLAMVEAKRNLNDLVHGFRLRQENLAWLVGDESGYPTDLYRTKDSPEGKFESARHVEQDRGFLFTRESFRQFFERNEQGYRLQGLWFITDRRPLLGITSAELERVLYRYSTDPSLNLSNSSGLGKFRKWVLSFIEPFQTRNVLELYAESETLARQIIFSR